MALAYELDGGFGNGPRLGMIVLSTDETIENEARSVMAGREVSMVHARIPAQPVVTPEALAMMEQEMPATAALLPQGMQAIAYACTSGATVIGPQRVEALVQQHHKPHALDRLPASWNGARWHHDMLNVGPLNRQHRASPSHHFW